MEGGGDMGGGSGDGKSGGASGGAAFGGGGGHAGGGNGRAGNEGGLVSSSHLSLYMYVTAPLELWVTPCGVDSIHGSCGPHLDTILQVSTSVRHLCST